MKDIEFIIDRYLNEAKDITSMVFDKKFSILPKDDLGRTDYQVKRLKKAGFSDSEIKAYRKKLKESAIKQLNQDYREEDDTFIGIIFSANIDNDRFTSKLHREMM